MNIWSVTEATAQSARGITMVVVMDVLHGSIQFQL